MYTTMEAVDATVYKVAELHRTIQYGICMHIVRFIHISYTELVL